MRLLKNKIIYILTKPRFIQSYKAKKAIIILLLFYVIAYVGYNLLMQVKPYLEPRKTIVIVQAKEKEIKETAKEATVEPKNNIDELMAYIWLHESTNGKKNFSQCEKIGKVNGIGYGIPDSKKWRCFDSHEDEMAVLKGWIIDKKAQGMSDNQLLCLYSGSNYSICK